MLKCCCLFKPNTAQNLQDLNVKSYFSIIYAVMVVDSHTNKLHPYSKYGINKITLLILSFEMFSQNGLQNDSKDIGI